MVIIIFVMMIRRSVCVPTDSTEKHSSFALSPSSHSARQDFKGNDGDDGDDGDDGNGGDKLTTITHGLAGLQTHRHNHYHQNVKISKEHSDNLNHGEF